MQVFLQIVAFSLQTDGSGTALSTNLCRERRSLKLYQNEHNSVKETGETAKKTNVTLT